MILTIAPIALSGFVGERSLPPEFAVEILARRPNCGRIQRTELAGAFTVQRFLAFLLLIPAYFPLSIATFSIIGEKQARSLEPVFAAPIRTVKLPAGKAIAALVPGSSPDGRPISRSSAWRRWFTDRNCSVACHRADLEVTLLQATGTLLVGAGGYLLIAAIVFVVSLAGLQIGVALFDHEAILTRWR